MRGNPLFSAASYSACGSIPAHAGEPHKGGGTAAVARVYPRACGGTDIVDLSDEALAGLSPRMRGNLNHATDPGSLNGSIPAHAGEPWQGGRRRWSRRVYPRACGGT